MNNIPKKPKKGMKEHSIAFFSWRFVQHLNNTKKGIFDHRVKYNPFYVEIYDGSINTF